MSRKGAVGASLLPVCRDPTYNNLYFVLSRERRQPKWNDGDRWSDFSGSVKFNEKGEICESPEETASREAWEESCAILKFREDDETPVLSCETLNKTLKDGNYILKIIFERPNGPSYVTYVVEVPFQPKISQLFQETIKCLTQRMPHMRANEVTQKISDVHLAKLFPGVTHPSINPETGYCDRSFTEKAAIHLFSVPQVVRALENNGCLIQKFGKTEYMRENFMSRLTVILRQLSLITSDKFQEMIQNRPDDVVTESHIKWCYDVEENKQQ